MDVGKIAAQTGHAFCDTLDLAEHINPGIKSAYRGDRHGTKVTLKAKTLNKFNRAVDEIRQTGLPHVLVIDRDHIYPPDFDGSDIITAIGVGPCRRDQIEHITKRLSRL